MSCAHATTGTAPQPAAIHDFCLIVKPVTFAEPHAGDVESAENKYDTQATVDQAKELDLKYDSVCPQ